jgi:hypothetical protein
MKAYLQLVFLQLALRALDRRGLWHAVCCRRGWLFSLNHIHIDAE